MINSVIKDANAHAHFLWREGQLVPWEDAKVHVSSVGHASVAAVFEGIKAYWNPDQRELFCFRLPEHSARLIASARMARLSCYWSAEEVTAAVVDLLRANETEEDTYIRPWLFAAGLVRDQMVAADTRTELVIDTWPFTAASPDRTCRACVSSWTRISDRFMPPRIKSFSNYSNGRLGMIEAQLSGYDCPIFMNENGMVTESAGACIATVKNGVVTTPPLSAGILDSITRASLITLFEEKRIPLQIGDLTRTDLYAADEAFFMGTGWEVMPISAVDGIAYSTPAPGPITAEISDTYIKVVRGETPDTRNWLTPVWANTPDSQEAFAGQFQQQPQESK